MISSIETNRIKIFKTLICLFDITVKYTIILLSFEVYLVELRGIEPRSEGKNKITLAIIT